jgi:hypothetical protein
VLDCHVIVSADTPSAWIESCLASVYREAEAAAFPVAVHVVDGVPGHIGTARHAGYALGDQRYVTCIDDDDYLLAGAFARLLEGMESNAKAISTSEIVLRNGHFIPGRQRHHLIAYRREYLIDHSLWRCCGDVAQMLAIPSSQYVDVKDPGYVHRVYSTSKARSLRRTCPDELRRAREQLIA